MIVALLMALLLAVLTLCAYADRVYSEMGKFLAREYQDNVDSWVEHIEPKFGLSRDSIALSASILRLTTVAALALLFGSALLKAGSALSFLTSLVELALFILLFDRLVPQILFARTAGLWCARIRWVFQALFYLISPLTLLLGLLLSIASLAEHEQTGEEDNSEEGVDALLEAGEEEGILEQSDRALVRSVVEFGDLVVREVMTPRPEIFAVPDTMTLAEFTEEVNRSAFSRVPVYAGTLDNITGIAFAHDLLRVRDEDAMQRTVKEMQRPAVLTPEPKRVNELLREMQSEKQHMRVVIDEYGTVAGLITIEDLIEVIFGSIEDEHEPAPVPHEAIAREPDGSWIVPGNLDLADLRDLLAARDENSSDPGSNSTGADSRFEERERSSVRLPSDIESTTVGGLVSELAGHIPLPGEVVEQDGLRLEVLTSTARLVTRVRVAFAPTT